MGVPFNWVSAATLQIMLAHVSGLKVGEFVWMGTDVHIYRNHFDAVEILNSRPTPENRARLNIINKRDSIDDFTIDDFELVGYTPQGVIKADVAV